MIPQVNALLTKVTGGGGSEDWTTGPGAGSTLWEGESGAYFTQKRERTFGPTDDVLVTSMLIVDSDLREWAEGETVRFTRKGIAMTGVVQTVEARDLPGHPLQTTRLTLQVQ
jgi:hypothetical protein